MSYQPPQPPYAPPKLPTSTPPVTSLDSFTEQGLSELKQHLAAEPVDAKRIQGPVGLTGITGRVDAAGAITAGTGFSVNKTGTGTYTVTFDVAFASSPTVVATNTSTGGGIPIIDTQTTTSFRIRCFNSAAATVDEAFNFLAFETV